MNLIDFPINFQIRRAENKNSKNFENVKVLYVASVVMINSIGKSIWECYEWKKCYSRMSLKSGTVMHRSELSFRYWFIAIHLLKSTRKTFSAKEVQLQLGHKRYQPIWHMMH